MSFSEDFAAQYTSDFSDAVSSACGPESRGFFGELTFDEIAELRKKYSAILIQLDHLRPDLLRLDTEFRPEGGWSIREIVGHLIDNDRDIWSPRIQALLTNHSPRFSDVDQEALVRKHNWQALPIQDIVAQFMRIRWANAVRLNEISPTDFQRTGEHPELGTLTLSRILQILVAHDAHYLGKIREAIEAGKPEHEVSH